MIVAGPEQPGKTGSRWFCVKKDCVVYDCTTPEQQAIAQQESQRMSLRNLQAVAETATRLIHNVPGELISFRTLMSDPVVVSGAVAAFDSIPDGSLTFDEILTPPDPVRPVLNYLFAAIRANMAFGAGEENLDELPAVQIDGLEGDATMLFSYNSLRALVSLYVSNAGIVKSLRAKLNAAEAAERRGNRIASANQLKAFVQQVRALSYRVLTPNAADVLITLAGSL